MREKTTLVSNLALAIASGGSRVVVVEADLRRPRIASVFGLDHTVGLTSVLSGRLSLDRSLQRFDRGSIDVLVAGAIPPNPSELLGSEHMRAVVRELERLYDVVLFDSAPLVPVTDSAVLASSVGSTILITRYRRTKVEEVQQAIDSLSNVGVRPAGCILSAVPRSDVASYGSKDGYAPLEESSPVEPLLPALSNFGDELTRNLKRPVSPSPRPRNTSQGSPR